ncbi:MAG: hypothetical protein ABSG23_09165 [Terriglobales bacterium]
MPYVDDVLQWLEHRKVVLEVIIAGQNCVLLWDIFFKQETLQWGKLLFLGASLMLLFAIVFLNYLATRKPTKPASDPQATQARQLAIDRIGKLLTLGDWLVGQAPNTGATASDFCRFWNEEMRRWSQEVGTILSDNWGEEAFRAFFSTRGLQVDQPAGRIHSEAASSYHQYNHWLQNLDRLKQTLPRS